MKIDYKTRERINDIINNIMIEDGPDRHYDGSNVITDFVVSILEGNDYEWWEQYKKEKNITE